MKINEYHEYDSVKSFIIAVFVVITIFMGVVILSVSR
jgi:hypothetical protein